MKSPSNESDVRNEMDQLLDAPIGAEEDDLLGFLRIAHSLSDAIKAQPNGASLTLGLDGPWGSGKSSILHLLRRSLELASHDSGIGVVVVPFSPWLVTNRTALVSAFFAQLSNAIELAEKRIPRNWSRVRKEAVKTLSVVRKRLNGFSKIVSIAATATSVFDPTLVSAVTAGSTKAVEKLTDDSGRHGKTLETNKQELTEALAQIAKADPSFRILVLVDDLDRLDPHDALEVLRLVKAVGDFPAITYLLAYDRNAIARAIEQSNKVDNGDIYLEKIIQFAFKVPPLEPFQLRNWLRVELEKLFPDTINFATPQCSAVLDTWAGHLLQTPRDVKRLLFSVRAIWPKLEGRADLLDLIWLQMVAQKASDKERDLYSWVVRYLQGLEAVAIGGTVTGKDRERRSLAGILKKIGWTEYDQARDGASFDFHHLDELLAGVNSNHLSTEEGDWIYRIQEGELQSFRVAKRLSSPWHWRLYFALDTPAHAVTDDEWEALVQAADKSIVELEKALVDVMEFRGRQRHDTTDQIIDRAMVALRSGQLDHADRWVVAMVERADNLKDRSKGDAFFGLSKLFEIHLKSFVRSAFKTFSGQVREDAIKAIFKQKATLYPAADLIRDQFHASQEEGTEKREKYYLTENELKEAIAAQIELYEDLTPEELRTVSDPYSILYAWRDIAGSSDGVKKLLDKAFEDDDGFLETLSSLRYVHSTAQKGVPHIPEEFLNKFIETSPLKRRLEKIAGGNGVHAERARKLLGLWWAPTGK